MPVSTGMDTATVTAGMEGGRNGEAAVVGVEAVAMVATEATEATGSVRSGRVDEEESFDRQVQQLLAEAVAVEVHGRAGQERVQVSLPRLHPRRPLHPHPRALLVM
jgi:hypothetical protein